LWDLDLSHNLISDISPLSGLTEPGWFDLRYNSLDITAGSPTMLLIQQLIAKDIRVIYLELGDLTGDSKVDVNDAIWLLRSIVNLAELSLNQEVAADVNGDGKVTVQDAILILRYIVGLIGEFPAL
ncbi:MAG: hypothetical protein GX364_04520, partial [Firmicutes bacterium]|nr:hypothetical protein [Bacillota bacterium]